MLQRFCIILPQEILAFPGVLRYILVIVWIGLTKAASGILRELGSVCGSTPVATIIHDTQLLDETELPTSLLQEHDLPVDIIATPTQVNIFIVATPTHVNICYYTHIHTGKNLLLYPHPHK